jgi:RNA polymerase sigma factor for flagellar operon FliA
LERIVNPPKEDALARGRRNHAPGAARHQRLWAAYLRKPADQTRNSLVEAYQPLVREVVRRFAMRLPRSVDRGDLETAANVGLMSAIEGFDPGRGVRFESYCELRVKGALLDELRCQDWLPRPWRQRLELQKRVHERLRAERGEEPSDEAMAREMEMDLAEYRLIFGSALPGAPAGSMPGAEGAEDAPPSLDIVADTHGDPPGERLTREELLHLVTQRLTAQEQRIIYLKYWEELPMREIGLLTNLSESRVCKIHARLLERLKDRFRVDAQE